MLLALGQAGFGAADGAVVVSAPAAGDVAQQMYQVQLAKAAPQQCQQPSSFDLQLALMQQQLQQQQQQRSSLDAQLTLMHLQQQQQQQCQEPSSLDSQLAMMQ
jgi:uncharacterized protein involved in exopolysaccharide biosynthesis